MLNVEGYHQLWLDLKKHQNKKVWKPADEKYPVHHDQGDCSFMSTAGTRDVLYPRNG